MAAGEDVSAGFGAILSLLADQGAAQRTLPLSNLTAVAGFGDWIAHPTRDDYWQGLSQHLRHDRIEVPVMHTAGWFDIFLAGTLENHRRLGGPLTIGPWSHGPATSSVGRIDFGFSASGQAAQLEQRELAFLASSVSNPSAGTAAPAASNGGAPVRIFVMGDNVWRDEAAWPLERAVPTRYYLRADGRLDPAEPKSPGPNSTDPASTELTSVGLVSARPTSAEPDSGEPRTYIHDPADPVPTLGGPLLLADATLVGPQEQRDIEARPDVLCYTSDVLAEDLEVTGPLSVNLRAATSAVSTDWTAKLVDVWPDGRAMSIIDGIVRVAAQPGVPAEHVIDLVATSQVFKAGHRIRVQIASSNFPRFDLNPGTGLTSADSDELVVARQCVYPQSWITLPVVPR